MAICIGNWNILGRYTIYGGKALQKVRKCLDRKILIYRPLKRFISRCLGVESCFFDFAFYKVDFSNLTATGRCRPGKLVKEIGYGFDFAEVGIEMSFPKPVIKLMI